MPEEMKIESLQPERGTPQPGATQVENAGPPVLGSGSEVGTGGRRPFVPPEHRIPLEQLPENLRAKFPEGMPAARGGGGDPVVPEDPLDAMFAGMGLSPEQVAVMRMRAMEGMKSPEAERSAETYRRLSRHMRRYDMAVKYGIKLENLPTYQEAEDVIFTDAKGQPLFTDTQKQRRIHHLQAAYASAAIADLHVSSEQMRISHILEKDPDQPNIETSIFWCYQLARAASQGEGFSGIEQFEQAVRPMLHREGLRGMAQMQFRLSVETADGQVYTGDISPARFWDVIDDPKFSQRLLEPGWGEAEEILLDPDKKSSVKGNYITAIEDVFKEVFHRYLRNKDGKGLSESARLINSNAFHWGFYTRISVDNLKSLGLSDIRDYLIGPFWGMYKAGFNIPFFLGRFSAWDKRARGRVEMPELRKAYLPHIYYGQLYEEGEVTNEDLMMAAYWHDLVTMKFDKLFPGFDARFNVDAAGNPIWESMQKAREFVEKNGGEWLEEWNEYNDVSELQKMILKRHTTRLGYSPARAIFGSMVVAGLRGEGPFAKQNIKKAFGWMKNLKLWHKSATAKYRKQHKEDVMVDRILDLNSPESPPNNRSGGFSDMSDNEHKKLLDRIIVGHFYDYFFKGPVGEALPFAGMGSVPWTRAEELMFTTVDFGSVLRRIGQPVDESLLQKPFWAYASGSKERLARQTHFGKSGFYRLLGFAYDSENNLVNLGDSVGYEHFNWERLEPKDLGSQEGYAGAAVASTESLYKLAVTQISNEPIEQFGMIAAERLDVALGKHLADSSKDFVKAMAYFDQHIRLRLIRDVPIITAQSSCEARPGAVKFKIKSREKYGTTHFVYEYDTTSGLSDADINWLKDRTWQVCGKYIFSPSRDPVRKITYVGSKGYAAVHEQYGGRIFGHNTVAEFARGLADISALNKVELARVLAEIHAESATAKTEITDREKKVIFALAAADVGEGLAKKLGGG